MAELVCLSTGTWVPDPDDIDEDKIDTNQLLQAFSGTNKKPCKTLE